MPSSPSPPHPLLFAPILLSKVWGGDRLAWLGKPVRTGDRIGESWELADLRATSASGAGGGAIVSAIASGPLAGQTIHDAIELWGSDLLGSALPPDPRHRTTEPRSARFPLLVKYLDARESLSVQVHPSIAYAKAHADVSIKTECWYILHGDPGAVIYKGVKPGVTRETFERHLREGDGRAVVDDLEAVPAVAGEMHNLPSGTLHALGAGVLVAEVQTPSDTTFRVYDWGRVGRGLHIEQALECINFGPARDATRRPAAALCARLVSTGFFTVDEILLRADRPHDLLDESISGDRPVVLMVIAGACSVAAPDESFPSLEAQLGATVLVPARNVRSAVLLGDARVLRISVLGV